MSDKTHDARMNTGNAYAFERDGGTLFGLAVLAISYAALAFLIRRADSVSGLVWLIFACAVAAALFIPGGIYAALAVAHPASTTLKAGRNTTWKEVAAFSFERLAECRRGFLPLLVKHKGKTTFRSVIAVPVRCVAYVSALTAGSLALALFLIIYAPVYMVARRRRAG